MRDDRDLAESSATLECAPATGAHGAIVIGTSGPILGFRKFAIGNRAVARPGHEVWSCRQSPIWLQG